MHWQHNHGAAGLAYTVEFSADMIRWTPSTDTPSPRTRGARAGDMDAVEMPFPATVPLNAGGSTIPKFFRLVVITN